MSDDAFVARLVRREPEAWREFLDRYDSLIYAVCAGVLPSRAEAEEAAAEVVRALLGDDCRLLKRFRPSASLASYLKVIAHSRAVEAARRTHSLPREVLGPVPEGPEEALLRAERLELLARAMAGLPSGAAALVRGHYLEGLCYAELALRTGLTERQVEERLAGARRALATWLKKKGDETRDRGAGAS